MRIVQPIGALPKAPVPPLRNGRRQRAPSRLPTIYATQPGPLRKLLRALGIDC